MIEWPAICMGCGNTDRSVLIPDSFRFTRSAFYKGQNIDFWLDVRAALCPVCHSKAIARRNARLGVALLSLVVGGPLAAIGFEDITLAVLGLLIFCIGMFLLVFTLLTKMHPSLFYSSYTFSAGTIYPKFASRVYQEAFERANPSGIRVDS
ncbi:MAG: hypothetical protein QXS20_10865 [Candidatus Thorarchaeota archaeon]